MHCQHRADIIAIAFLCHNRACGYDIAYGGCWRRLRSAIRQAAQDDRRSISKIDGRNMELRTVGRVIGGDGFQAESAWKALDGGSRNNGKLKTPEQYQVKFIPSAQIGI
uniref:Uncharacterized protein n=1 Tax=Craspedostauros australis TaxID=1486917 RepID=A0A7R9WXR7_9STRA